MPAAEHTVVEFALGDDAEYEAWISENTGYVLTQRGTPSGSFMLHTAWCTHLSLTPGRWRLTARPRRCAATREALAEWSVSRTGALPLLCRSCM